MTNLIITIATIMKRFGLDYSKLKKVELKTKEGKELWIEIEDE